MIDTKKISKITLGTVQIGLKYGIANKTGKPSEEKAHEILDTAYDGGINSFDTSIAYGDSEKVLGNYFKLPKNKEKDVFITTKLNFNVVDKEDNRSIEKKMFDIAEESMKRLNLNTIPLYLLHNPLDMIRYGKVVPETLEKMKRIGMIERAGVSIYSTSEAEEMLRNDIYEAIQIPMSMFDFRFIKSGILDKFSEKGINVFIRTVFLQGIFFIKPETLPANYHFLYDYLKELNRLSQEIDVPVSHIAFSFIRDLKGVTSLVLGAETPEQVAENVRLIECKKLEPVVREKIEEKF